MLLLIFRDILMECSEIASSGKERVWLNGQLKNAGIQAKPILKWAGGKTQMLGDLLPKVPASYGRYIEPFIVGGALFFALNPKDAVIADRNPELINLYKQVADHVEDVISYLQKYQNTQELFYSVRALEWQNLPSAEAAARMIFLNKTCFNGLYRVNREGKFNVPYGKYKAPNFCDIDALHAASEALKQATIVCAIICRYCRSLQGQAILFFWTRRIYLFLNMQILSAIQRNSFMRRIMWIWRKKLCAYMKWDVASFSQILIIHLYMSYINHLTLK